MLRIGVRSRVGRGSARRGADRLREVCLLPSGTAGHGVVVRPDGEAVGRRAAAPARISDKPPQMPYGSRVASACCRHSVITGQLWQITFACSIRRVRSLRPSSRGWKNISTSIPRQAANSCQSHSSLTGCGRRRSMCNALSLNGAESSGRQGFLKRPGAGSHRRSGKRKMLRESGYAISPERCEPKKICSAR